MKNDTSKIVDLDAKLKQLHQTNTQILSEAINEGNTPPEVAARIDLVEKFNLLQSKVDKMTSNEVLLEYNKQSKKFNIDSILEEWAWRCDKGYPDFNNKADMYQLQLVLEEMKIENPFPKISEAPIKTVKSKSTIKLPESTTGLKEGLVMYFACQKIQDIEAAIKKIDEKSDAKLKFTTKVIDSKLYNGNEEPAADNVAYAIDYLNKYVIENAELKKTYLNALTSAKKIIKDIGVVNPKLIDRGAQFSAIKEHATDLLQGADVNIGAGEADKWCPADIFIYGDSKVINSAENTTSVNVDSKKQKSLNALFHDKFNKPKPGTILGISLKEEKARAGKATSFQKLLIGGKDYVVKEKDTGQEIVTKLLYNFSSIMRVKGGNVEPIYKIGDCAEALNYINRFSKEIADKGDAKSLSAVKLGLEKTLKTTFKADVKNANNKENAKKLFKTGKYVYPTDSSKILKNLKDAITLYRRSLIDFARSKYKVTREEFLDIVKKSGFKEPSQPEVKFVETEDISKVSDIFLKKAGCYEAAAKLLDGYQVKAKLALPPAFDSIVNEDKNVFLALTAYAVSQGGISPTFFKLIGGSSGTTEAHVKTFPSDGVLTLVPGGEVEIEDKPTNAGFDVSFICQIKSETGVNDKYAVVLSFAFAGTQFKIEVQELKEV